MNAFFSQTCKHYCVCQPSSLPDICPDDTDSKTNGLLPQNTYPWWNPVTYIKAAWQKTKRRRKTTQTKNKIYKRWISTHWKVRKAFLNHCHCYRYSIVCCLPFGDSTNFYVGRLRPRSNRLSFIYLSDRKGTPFAYLLYIDKWYPFHLPLLELCIPFNSCKCTVLKIWINHKPRTFSWPFHSHKMHL